MVEWILVRDGEVRGIFKNRRKAISHLKKYLEQSLSDFDKQDKSDEFDYVVKLPEIILKPVENRASYLGFIEKRTFKYF